jgi:hypothetical protein
VGFKEFAFVEELDAFQEPWIVFRVIHQLLDRLVARGQAH